MKSFSEIPILQRETQTSLSYQWSNLERTMSEGIVIQQTLSGSLAYWDSSGRHEAGEGQALLFRYGEPTRYGLDRACHRPYRLIWALITETPALLSMYQDVIQTFGPVVRMDPKGEAATILAHTLEAHERGVSRDRLVDAEIAIRIMISIYREQITEQRGYDPVSYGRHLLETQFRSPRNLKEWAEEIGWTREHFTREFRARYNETPADFLRRQRLQHAKQLLFNTTLTLEDISVASGFASVKTFYRVFRDQYGAPPGEFRP